MSLCMLSHGSTFLNVSKHGVFPGSNTVKYNAEKRPHLGTCHTMYLSTRRTLLCLLCKKALTEE